MKQDKYVSNHQDCVLKELGYNDYQFGGVRLNASVDEVIDWIRRKYNVVIYNSADPFVSPNSNKILYSYEVKACSTYWGWNMREIIGKTGWSSNHYGMKRQAITMALRWIKKHHKIKTNGKSSK